MVDEVLKEVDVDEVMNEDVKGEQDEIDIVVEDVEAGDECGVIEDVKDEADDVILVVAFNDQDEVEVDVVDACVKGEIDFDVGVVDDVHVVHVDDVVDDLF